MIKLKGSPCKLHKYATLMRLTFADSSVRNVLGRILVETLFTVIAVSTGCVVSAVNANTATVPSREFEQLHVEHARFCMQVTVAGYRSKKSRESVEGSAET